MTEYSTIHVGNQQHRTKVHKVVSQSRSERPDLGSVAWTIGHSQWLSAQERGGSSWQVSLRLRSPSSAVSLRQRHSNGYVWVLYTSTLPSAKTQSAPTCDDVSTISFLGNWLCTLQGSLPGVEDKQITPGIQPWPAAQRQSIREFQG